jgi:predicted nucleic acid-binding protein
VIIIDSSAVVEVLLRAKVASRVEDRIFSPAETLHTPQLLDVEVAQVLRRYCLAGEMDPGRGGQALRDLTEFSITRYPHHLFLSRIWQLRYNMTAYDAVYVALAEVLSASLLTLDAHLASTPGHNATIEFI